VHVLPVCVRSRAACPDEHRSTPTVLPFLTTVRRQMRVEARSSCHQAAAASDGQGAWRRGAAAATCQSAAARCGHLEQQLHAIATTPMSATARNAPRKCSRSCQAAAAKGTTVSDSQARRHLEQPLPSSNHHQVTAREELACGGMKRPQPSSCRQNMLW
jgi:hypothetical protein